MKGMIFAAGVGSRLKPFTDFHPKALLPVGGVPMLRRVLDNMAAAGVDEVVVNVHHFASQITDYLEANTPSGMRVSVSDESGLLLDTGGGLLKAAPMLDAHDSEPVILHNADILTDVDLGRMLREHIDSGADVTLLASQRMSSRMLYFDCSGRLKGWKNLNTGETKPEGFVADGLMPLAFGGVHVVSPSVFPLLAEYSAYVGAVFSTVPFYLANVKKLLIKAYRPEDGSIWHDVGSMEKLAAAEASLKGL